MELRIIFPVLSMLSSGIFHTAALPASLTGAAGSPASARHARSKRCSCSTFLDKECVYFCHLDIIWVNTPERTVSYGLGNAPRRKRSVARAVSIESARCRCADSRDGACASFCNADYPPRRKAAPDKVIPSACGHDCAEKQRKHGMAAQTQSMKWVHKRTDHSRVKRQLHVLLEKLRLRFLHNAQARAAENAAS
ncbi:endothelin-1 [Hoplias malabaricus]|uniref:endothelin-1 n=1 Tax=Hoplias malabaricus TaxID=27720 RepID=UPI0034632DD0